MQVGMNSVRQIYRKTSDAQIYLQTYRRKDVQKYTGKQRQTDRQTDRQTVQKCRKADKQIDKSTDILYIYLRYIQTDQQTDRTDKYSKTNRPTRQIDSIGMLCKKIQVEIRRN